MKNVHTLNLWSMGDELIFDEVHVRNAVAISESFPLPKIYNSHGDEVNSALYIVDIPTEMRHLIEQVEHDEGALKITGPTKSGWTFISDKRLVTKLTYNTRADQFLGKANRSGRIHLSLGNMKDMPSLVLHELAHVIHDRETYPIEEGHSKEYYEQCFRLYRKYLTNEEKAIAIQQEFKYKAISKEVATEYEYNAAVHAVDEMWAAADRKREQRRRAKWATPLTQ